MHLVPALSAGSRPDYQKSDGECHAKFGVLLLVVNTTVPAKQSQSEAMTINKMFNRDNRFIDLLGGLQSFRHYVTGPLVPNTRTNYSPAQA